MTQTVGVLSTWAATRNLGDYVIGDACLEALWSRQIRVSEAYPTHVRPPTRHLRRALRAKCLILAGTTALTAKMGTYLNFWVTPDLAASYRRRVVLMGVGWGSDDTRTSRYTRWVIDQLLDPEALHSVRDSFTAQILQDLGYRVVMTGCPSVWGIEHLPEPAPPESTAIITVNSGKPSVRRDRQIVHQVADLFPEWVVQPMDVTDVPYATDALDVPASHILPATMTSFDRALGVPSVTVGVRLHAGIRGLQRGRQAVIVAIDHRAREMGRDVRLPIVEWDDESSLHQMLLDAPRGEVMTPDQRVAVRTFLDELETHLADA